MKIIISVNGVPVRLTPERLMHIESRHPEMKGQEILILETTSTPDLIQEGDAGTLIALKYFSKTPLLGKFCAVIYKETGHKDGFILTAYFTNKHSKERRTLWKR